ncbi:MAG: MFS transporter, partial [Lentisphaeria bacterium]|nr:MFS transporter [Lentisphaeria bacterium]
MRLIPETVPFDPKRVPFFYGYVVIGFSMVGMLMSVPGQTMGVSAFTDHLIRDLGITRVDLTTAYMIGTLASSFLMTWAGRMYDRFGARIMSAVAALGLGVVLMVLSVCPRIVGVFGGMAAAGVVVMSVGFFLLRFFGQGMMTLTSRNMLMEWFERRRGLANGIRAVFVSFGFSLSPKILDSMIAHWGWQGAWRILAVVIGIGFCAFTLVFYRDKPESCGLLPDGRTPDDAEGPDRAGGESQRAFTLKEARRTYTFWVFILTLGLLGLYYTAFTFHVVSLFEQAGRTRTQAFAMFFPASIISVTVSFIAGWASDRVRLKYLLMLMLGGTAVAMLGLCNLESDWGMWFLIGGNGVALGHFSLISGVTWPK